LLGGRFQQQRAQRTAADAAGLLAGLAPSTARLVEGAGPGAGADTGAGERVREVPTEALVPGMVVETRAGDTIPADGVVLEGASSVDLSLLTGESRPVAVAAGEPVFAGTVNLAARLRVVVEKTGEESRIGRLLREVELGASRRAPVVLLADRMAGAFVGVVIALAVAAFVLWWNLDRSRALDTAIAMLIVTCPCALALATPLAITVAVGRAARAGILIKNGQALERLARPGLLWLDKTGTITEGRFALVRAEGRPEALVAAAALERHVRHPIADAWLEHVGGPLPEATDVRAHPGRGVEGRVEGRHVVVGSPAFVQSRIRLGEGPAAWAPVARSHDAGTGDIAPLTPVWVALDGELAARVGLGDRVRGDAAPAIAGLVARGWDARILSGDDGAIVQGVAHAVGVSPVRARGDATPEQKLAAVEEAERDGAVVMVGDGVNDAAAIARASVGIGVRGGAEACLDACDVYLARPGLAPLVELVDGAERTMRLIRRSLGLSLAYNVVAAGLALAGLMNPLVAAIVMPLSSITVVLASTWTRTFDAPPAASGGAAERTRPLAEARDAALAEAG
jgi:Cu2+-exporting ATPase